MSFLLPSNLTGSQFRQGSSADTGYRRPVQPQDDTNMKYGSADLSEVDYGPKSDGCRPYIYSSHHDAGYGRPRRGSTFKMPLESDQHGAELGKAARIWKVYVEEANDWDEELVNGWNKSLDATLVFAALFSAILTAFLIEISGRLREDSGDEMSRTLVTISRTLMDIANGTRPEQAASAPAAETTSFIPSGTAVLVSTLWYLSLSLSVATSFLAVLGKSWCHSFMAGRTGNPCIQARRRQQKLEMIERWKMQEFFVMLPSLIHLALLLFSIGLCIYVWDLNQTVALPVICVAGTAVSFYICSTLAASIIDFFPYTTTTAKILRSEPMKEVYLIALWILRAVLVFLSYIPMLFLVTAEYLTERSPTLHRHVGKWLESFVEWSNNSPVILSQNLPEAKCDENPKQDRVTSNALCWLIQNCEVSSSVNIALQAIAGANEDLPRQPLEACKAALLISRRLASCQLYNEPAADWRRIDLYVRAISFLGSPPHVAFKSSTNETVRMIRDLQSENEADVASLVIDGNFTPEDHNLQALRIGSTAALQSLQRLGGQRDDTTMKIVQLLRQHLDGAHELHSAALVSLVNTATLLSVCSPCDTDTMLLASICMQLLDKNIYWLNIEPKYGVTFAMCALLQNKHADRGSLAGQVNEHWIRSALHALLETQAPRKECSGKLVWFAVAEVLSNPEAYGIEFSQSPKLYYLLNSAVKSISSIWNVIPAEQHVDPNNAAIESHLSDLQRVYTLSRAGAPISEVYVFVVEVMCCVPSDRVKELCGDLLSRFCFPGLSIEMVERIEQRNLVKVLKTTLQHQSEMVQLIGISQLWLLYTFYHHSYSTHMVERDKLYQQLKMYSPWQGKTTGQVLRYLEESMQARFQTMGSQLGSASVYICRILECILQARGSPASEPEWATIQATLTNIPSSLQGLQSLT